MPTYLETLEEKTSALRAPIAPDRPGGTDMSFDPAFEQVKAEVDKLQGLAGTLPNWSIVASGADTLLRTKVKDLRLATWLVVAKMNLEGWSGLAEAVCVYRALLRDFWPVLFPEVKRARARANLVLWMGDQIVAFFEPKIVTANNADGVRASSDLLTNIDVLLAEKLGDLYPGPGRLRSLMRDKLRVLPELTPPPVASTAPAPPTAVPQASAPAQRPADRPRPAEPVRVVDRADLGRVLEASAKTLQNAAETMRRADPARPLAYRVQRLALWLDLEDAPPTEDGLTRLPPPDDRDRTLLDTLMAAASWTDLLRRAEELTGQYLFWFDLHWMVALAMERLGALFVPARDEVGRELVMLLMRFPTLAGLRFSDGTAFARPQAVAWLEGEQKKLGAGGGSGPSAASAEDDEVTRRFDEARELVSGGKTAEGLALAMALSQRGADARVRFRSRLTVARLAMDSGRVDVARPLYEGLLDQVALYRLEEWEPTLCASLYGGLLTCLKALAHDDEAHDAHDARAKQAAMFDKLCCFDPSAAIKLAP